MKQFLHQHAVTLSEVWLVITVIYALTGLLWTLSGHANLHL